MANKHIYMDEIKGCAGNFIAMNDYRVADPNPCGGVNVVKNLGASVDDVIRALRDNDFVKVVRCKDCKQYTSSSGCIGIMPGYGFDVKPDDFCSYGERREGE